MAAVAGGDWRDGRAYACFLSGDRRCFAWEWLRRSSAYIDAYADNAAPAAFGLLRFENPMHDALAARPFWHADADRAVLRAEARAAGPRDQFELGRLERLASFLSHQGEHILFSDGLRSIRLDMLSGSLAGGPAALSWHIDGVADAGPQVLALRQFVALARSGGFSRSLHRPERRARRWVQMLRVHDALATGATHREIAGALFGIDVAGPRWRVSAGPWRLRVQRLAAGARACLASGPAGWLGDDG